MPGRAGKMRESAIVISKKYEAGFDFGFPVFQKDLFVMSCLRMEGILRKIDRRHVNAVFFRNRNNFPIFFPDSPGRVCIPRRRKPVSDAVGGKKSLRSVRIAVMFLNFVETESC